MLTIRDQQKSEMAAARPGQQLVAPCVLSKTWVEFRLVDDNDDPVPGQPYRAKLPDGSITSGTLDSDGKVRFEGVVAGQASITFTELDAKEWKRL